MDKEKVRLTQMVTTAGCAAKIFPDILSETLKDIQWATNENVLVGFEGKDDAGVYKISDKLALIHTTDFFTPVVDDPFIFGQIAAANALSDVYAMGGVPINALNILAFPQKEDLNILKEILKGGSDKINESGAVIIGGHSIDITNIVYGMAVTGTIDPENLKGNNSARPGDKLILTKSLGTGILNNAIKFSFLEKSIYDKLISSMTRLNKNASECMLRLNANACTDITGFGLAGHSMQMAKASNVVIRFEMDQLPVLEGTDEAIKDNYLTRGDRSNRDYTKNSVVSAGNINKNLEHLAYDPQTSGGLLISVPAENATMLLLELEKGGDIFSKIVGEVSEPTDERKAGTVIFNYS
ncbi:MAG TPA: selenide, water dikinase SelD [Ignavibacteria bacterium]|nr:selenide, water dikinase SelD [Ignavibacteria bacterium]HMR39362.1 selenide, water dikinase SelD [Ignavibacteria bacterium]